MKLCHFFFLCTVLFGSGGRAGGFRVRDDDRGFDSRVVGKRNDEDFQSCLDNFDIHTDKIIRTQDSRAMGAKYINERDVGSREDCLRLCCSTDNCDVFVFEEKSPGSCYLFECGSPEDFKCKFTRHRNYTSAVLAVNRHLTELESQIKFTQHEHELTKLREPIHTNSAAEQKIVTTTELPLNKEIIQIVPFTSNDQQKSNACSRYQFSCHTSGECIAIYNACDGVPQCADGSDEAPELGCPVQASSTPQPKQGAVTVLPHIGNLKPIKTEVDPNSSDNHNLGLIQQQYQPNVETMQRQWPQQQPYMRQHLETDNSQGSLNGLLNSGQQTMNQDMLMQNARASYGREGEGMAYHSEQNWPYQYHANSGGSQIFTHKGNGLVQQAERYQQHQYLPQDASGLNVGQYSEQIPGDYAKYNYPDNVPYRMFPQNTQMNNWQQVHKQHTMQGGNILDESMTNRNPDREHMNSAPQDYYYDEVYRNRGQSQMQRYQPHSVPNAALNNELVQQQPILPKPTQEQLVVSHLELASSKNNTPLKTETAVHLAQLSTTSKPKSIDHHTHIHSAHRKIEKLTAEVTLRETSFTDAEMDGHNSSPSGAILSLTFGLCITGIMIVLVGCRMRMVHKRMRRGGKSPYAHDADFLVNGMYL